MGNTCHEFQLWLNNLGELKTTPEKDSVLFEMMGKKIRFLKVYDGASSRKVNDSEICVWEDFWTTQRKLVEGRIRVALGLGIKLHARQTQVEKVTRTTAEKFMTNNHLHGFVKGKTYLSLKQGQDIVSMAIFSKSCPIDRGETTWNSVEILRYCSLNGTLIRGGLSKLLSHFENRYQPEDLMTYIDREWSSGKGFEKMGFERSECTLPHHFKIDRETLKRYYRHQWDSAPSDAIQICNKGSYKLIKELA